MANLLFYLMALGVVGTGVGVIVARSPVVSVVSLLGSLFCLAVIYLLAGYQFLAAIQILVYGGAVMVLFLFVVMLLNLGDAADSESPDEPLFHGGPRAAAGLGVAVVLGAAGLIGILRGARHLAEGELAIPAGGLDPVQGLAQAMFTRYSLPFEAASVLLLATAVGVLVIAKRNRPDIPRAFADHQAEVVPPNPAPPAPAQPQDTQEEREEVLS